MHRNRNECEYEQKKKHNATLSPLLNWKLQRINNVRLFGLCIWLFFSFFSRSFFSSIVVCTSRAVSSFYRIIIIYRVFFRCIIESQVKCMSSVWNWNGKQFMRFVKFLCVHELDFMRKYMWPGIFDRVLFTRNCVRIYFPYRRFK